MLSSGEIRLTEALNEYLCALDSGNPPDRRAFLSRYPAIASELGAAIDGLERMRGAAPELQEPFAEWIASGTTPGDTVAGLPLGDFRIMREIGRGGMGIVYQVEQLSLSRIVALKVLPFASALDEKQLRRFRAEAQAAAQLHHPHIVAVYAVGCERGVHFYAMQFVDGQPLAEIIRELRPDSVRRTATDDGSTAPFAALATERSQDVSAFFHSVARFGVQAAEALTYAHNEGIIHRDIKPANLLISAQKKLWIADFGLARIGNDANLTRTGDVLGTARY